jgi:hypothetical protein
VADILRLMKGLDVRPLERALEREEALFKEITARQDTAGSYHQDTETIFIRWTKEQTVYAAFNDLVAVDYPAVKNLPELTRPLVQIMQTLQVRRAEDIGRILIVRFKPKGFIAPHIDEGAYADHYERVHLSITSEPGNHFMVESDPDRGEFVHMEPGSLYWFNHKKKHSVVNFSDKPRIHMIVDAVIPALRREREL